MLLASAFSFHQVNLFEMLISKSKVVLGGHNFSQGAQQSMTKLQHGLQSTIMFMNGNGGKVAPIKLPEGIPGQILHAVTTTPIWSFEKELEAWRQNSSWIDENPTIQISVPKDAFCQVNSQFKIGIPPDVVYDIITDPGNKRVF